MRRDIFPGLDESTFMELSTLNVGTDVLFHMAYLDPLSKSVELAGGVRMSVDEARRFAHAILEATA